MPRPCVTVNPTLQNKIQQKKKLVKDLEGIGYFTAIMYLQKYLLLREMLRVYTIHICNTSKPISAQRVKEIVEPLLEDVLAEERTIEDVVEMLSPSDPDSLKEKIESFLTQYWKPHQAIVRASSHSGTMNDLLKLFVAETKQFDLTTPQESAGTDRRYPSLLPIALLVEDMTRLPKQSFQRLVGAWKQSTDTDRKTAYANLLALQNVLMNPDTKKEDLNDLFQNISFSERDTSLWKQGMQTLVQTMAQRKFRIRRKSGSEGTPEDPRPRSSP